GGRRTDSHSGSDEDGVRCRGAGGWRRGSCALQARGHSHGWADARDGSGGMMIAEIFRRIREQGQRPIWISLCDEKTAIAKADSIDPTLPLAGVPFAVKDNFDVAGMPTTAGCPSFAYVPERSATVVQRLLDAGAILIGKTNMDQFATGLVGTRSPYGACSSVYDSRYISGGSSSG